MTAEACGKDNVVAVQLWQGFYQFIHGLDLLQKRLELRQRQRAKRLSLLAPGRPAWKRHALPPSADMKSWSLKLRRNRGGRYGSRHCPSVAGK